MTFVFDTNVLVSALLIPRGNEAELLQLWYRQRFDLAVSQAILQEYREVLHRSKFKPYFGYTDAWVDELIENFIEAAEILPGITPVDPIRNDHSDEKFLSCAFEAKADGVVTGDKRHLLLMKHYQGIEIITPKACLKLFSPPDLSSR